MYQAESARAQIQFNLTWVKALAIPWRLNSGSTVTPPK